MVSSNFGRTFHWTGRFGKVRIFGIWQDGTTETTFTLFSNSSYRNLRNRRTLHRIHHQILQNHRRRNLHLRLRGGHRDLLHTHLHVRRLRGVRIHISSREFA